MIPLSPDLLAALALVGLATVGAYLDARTRVADPLEHAARVLSTLTGAVCLAALALVAVALAGPPAVRPLARLGGDYSGTLVLLTAASAVVVLAGHARRLRR